MQYKISEIGPYEGLVSYWTLNGHTDDLSGNNYHGTLNGYEDPSPHWVNGIFGSALEFDGTGINITIPEQAYSQFNTSQPWSISVWVKPDISTMPDDMATVFDVRDSEGFTDTGRITYLRYNVVGQQWEFAIDDDTVNEAVITWGSLSTEWVHFACSWDGAGEAILYVNGLPVGTSNDVGNTSHVPAYGVIGGGAGSPTDDNFSGLIENFRIYDRTITAEEAYILYEMGADPKIKISDDTLYIN